jgi:DNA-directed RNA polymerase specialized sigma24 family protein
VAERLNAAALKAVRPCKRSRGFESHPLRHSFKDRTASKEDDPSGSSSSFRCRTFRGSYQPTSGNRLDDHQIARPKRKAPEAKAKLKAFAKTYGQHERELEKEAERLRDERDKAIRGAYREGMPMVEIGKVLKMSQQRVSQIVRS